MKKYWDKYTIAIWGAVALTSIGYIAILHSATYWGLNTLRGCTGAALMLGIWGIYGSWKSSSCKRNK